MFEAAGLKGNGQEESMRNVLRHSFCTYHVAMDKDAARTAVLLTHRSPAMLYRYYRGRASEADGKAYFRIEP
jgi:integrase